MARKNRRQLVVTEDLTQEVLNDVRDAERRVFNRIAPEFQRELERRAGKHVETGNYSNSMFAEVDKKALVMRGGSSAPHAHLVELGTGPRQTDSGANRGTMPGFGVIRKSALAIRRKVFDEVEQELKRV
jgi:hypothetical protein